MYRLVGTCYLRSLQSRLPGVRSSLKGIMDTKQEDITQPIGKQQPQEEARKFTTDVTTLEGEHGKSITGCFTAILCNVFLTIRHSFSRATSYRRKQTFVSRDHS